MGFLDNFLNAAESGDLEKKLGQVADVVDNTSQRAQDALDKVAGKPGEALAAVERGGDTVLQRAQEVARHTPRSIDVIHKKD